ncbi:MAG: trypsin-like peptidase domain-containing protein [Lentisphaeria bacterium]|nr:trypsin-like peptidase domain-containing protein [Lentisphaeria bacterium]
MTKNYLLGAAALFGAALLCGAEPAGEPEKKAPETEAAGQEDSLMSKIRENHKAGSATERESDSFLIVKSEDGRGSAFLTRLWNQPVIVTNAHVLLTMKDPEILDINGRKYVPREVLASKTRDLVIVSYEGADRETREILKVVGDAGAVPIEAKVTAYGNSLGEDVIVTQKGKLLGIGPDKIEVDAAFVPGNSGGPVVLDEGGEVIGVSTYLSVIRPDMATTGSKYEASKIKNVVRRFATRIDNLDPADLEPIRLDKLERERELVRKSDDWVAYIREAYKEKFTLEKFQDFRSEALKRARILFEGEALTWQSSYLRKKFSENREGISGVLSMWKLDFLIGLSRVGAELEENAGKLAVARKAGFPVRCFFCVGSGKRSVKKTNPQYRPNSACARWIIEYTKCPVCSGNGKRPLWPERVCFTYPKTLEDEAGRHIAASEQKFCGFRLGGSEEEELNRFVFYRKAPLYVIPEAFGETRVYAGNHFDRSASCTMLTFMFGRLLGVMVLTPQIEAGGLEEGLTRYLDGEIADSSPFFVSALRIRGQKAVPVDSRGKPLLKPVRGKRLEDEPRYEGMWIVGMHSCFGVIAAMDLEDLAKKAAAQKGR